MKAKVFSLFLFFIIVSSAYGVQPIQQQADTSLVTILSAHIGENVEVYIGTGLTQYGTVKLKAVYKDCFMITNDDGDKFRIIPFHEIVYLSKHRNGNFLIQTQLTMMGQL